VPKHRTMKANNALVVQFHELSIPNLDGEEWSASLPGRFNPGMWSWLLTCM